MGEEVLMINEEGSSIRSEFTDLNQIQNENDSDTPRADDLALDTMECADFEGMRIDFILVWNESGNAKIASAERRRVFESNLQKEGLVLEHLPREPSGLHFIKIHAPDTVLKRYAEILKLRLPMKKFDHITEIKMDSFRVPIFTDVVEGVQTTLDQFLQSFRVDQKLFKSKANELTATFSRDKEYLFDTDDPDFFAPYMRSRIVEFILKRKRISDDIYDEFAFGIDRCLSDGTYTASYPLHDGGLKKFSTGTRKLLYEEWASFSKILKYQPIDAVRDYYGVKIAIYFAWLGFYTNLLIPPAIFGFIVFIYGVLSLSYDIPSQSLCRELPETRNQTLYMCPACDVFCDYWDLRESCLHSKIMYLFDNEMTIVFAIFMSFWAALFLEFWRRYSEEITHRWNVRGYDPEEEHPRPKYLAQLKDVKERTINFVTQTTEPRLPFWKRKFPGLLLSVSTVIFMICLGFVAVVGVILYRMSMVVALSLVNEETIKSHASLFISSTGASINLVCILIFNQVYGYVAIQLTELELHRTQTQFDDSLSLKIYLLQFVNYYASIFYIAFFKGRFVGYPGNYIRIFGHRQEECSPGGCYMEVCLQMAIIFVGKQFLLSVVEYQLPRIWKILNTLTVMAGINKEEKCVYPQWIQDYKLVEYGNQGLFYEYLEMVIQYGFITIFVTAFPLAPLFALLNNLFELRLDAKKLLVHHRRPVAQRVKDIGVWLNILDSVGRIAVLTNGLIIAFTSDFVPRMLYKLRYSEDQTLKGYLNFTLSKFNPNDFSTTSMPQTSLTPEYCFYHGYRYPPGHEKEYEVTQVFWHVMAARLCTVVVYQNFVNMSVMAIRWIIPNFNTGLKEKIRREAYLTNEIIIRTELLKAKGELDANTLEEEIHVVEAQNSEIRSNKRCQKSSDSRPDLNIIGRAETGDITDGQIIV
ncbi:anoctamin-1 isoform X1 [Lepeophtheirus salmonis]|uniref:anoctamin-1 isoform X1 n=1 Tax=Lepeophtheirus salmonis TaxID=72036 RepID=UPI001AE3E8D4|nr:anoctamin-1-like isoform X1 [Lepeophtheirus salmonis]